VQAHGMIQSDFFFNFFVGFHSLHFLNVILIQFRLFHLTVESCCWQSCVGNQGLIHLAGAKLPEQI
jgi:hypothetical protein